MGSALLCLSFNLVLCLPFAEVQVKNDWQPVINMGEMVLPLLQYCFATDPSSVHAASVILGPRIEVRLAQLDSPLYVIRQRASEELNYLSLLALEPVLEIRAKTKSAEVLYRLDLYLTQETKLPDFSKRLPPYKKE